MTYYFDLSDLGGWVGIIANPGDSVVFTGTRLHREPEKYRGCEPAERFARENDLHFWYDDEMPRLSVYTVPRVEIGGYDSRGGLFVGSMDFTLRDAEPLYYIDRERRCFMITDDSRTFSGMGRMWRERMVPTDAIAVFSSLEEAMKRYAIRKPKDVDELLAMLKEMDDQWEGAL